MGGYLHSILSLLPTPRWEGSLSDWDQSGGPCSLSRTCAPRCLVGRGGQRGPSGCSPSAPQTPKPPQCPVIHCPWGSPLPHSSGSKLQWGQDGRYSDPGAPAPKGSSSVAWDGPWKSCLCRGQPGLRTTGLGAGSRRNRAAVTPDRALGCSPSGSHSPSLVPLQPRNISRPGLLALCFLLSLAIM